ncbi:MAG: DUF2237 domain-containing protein [Pseudomonadota bacterium]|nr:DUF2237 domain-containing protein [Pseudomonadota bacterium]
MDGENFHENYQRNVLGGRLQSCSSSPMTGFFRDGCCHTGPQDVGSHTVCAVMTDAFLAFSLAAGNDLSTPRPEFDFPGLKAGDRWCLCAARWEQARQAGHAPKIRLASTNQASLAVCNLDDLKAHAIDLN